MKLEIRLLCAYFFFIPFTQVLFLPTLGAKVQLPELIFLGLLPAIIWRFRREKINVELPSIIVIGLIAYLVTNIASSIVSNSLQSFLEALGRVYLAIVLCVSALMFKLERHKVSYKILKCWYLGAVFMASLGIIGYVLAISGYITELVRVYLNYPYFGTWIRASGLAGTPGMFIWVLMLPTLWSWYYLRRNFKFCLGFFVLLMACILSWSKEIVLLVLGCVLLDPWITRLVKNVSLWMFSGIVIIFFWFLTHVIIISANEVSSSYLGGTDYTSERILYTSGEIQLIETSYLALKRAAYSIGTANPWLGVGPGQFNNYLAKVVNDRMYPIHLPIYDPHSTWWGSFAETGILGVLALFIFCYSLVYLAIRNINTFSKVAEAKIIAIYLLIILVESVHYDVMNFRHLWAPLGLFLGVLVNAKHGMGVNKFSALQK